MFPYCQNSSLVIYILSLINSISSESGVSACICKQLQERASHPAHSIKETFLPLSANKNIKVSENIQKKKGWTDLFRIKILISDP